MKTDKGYVAVPWQTDFRVWWYRKSLFDDAGAKVPTTWDELMTAGEALKKKGYFGFGDGAGAGNNIGAHTMVIDDDQQRRRHVHPGRQARPAQRAQRRGHRLHPRSWSKAGISDPASVSYTADNHLAQWKNKKFAFGIYTAGLDQSIGEPVAATCWSPAR